MRAFKKTTLVDGDGDCWLEKKEFPFLLPNLLYFSKLFVAFDASDTGTDGRIDLAEFKAGLHHIGMELPAEEAEEQFKSIDTDNGGKILFDEFCAWAAKRGLPVDGVVMTGFTESDANMGSKD